MTDALRNEKSKQTKVGKGENTKNESHDLRSYKRFRIKRQLFFDVN